VVAGRNNGARYFIAQVYNDTNVNNANLNINGTGSWMRVTGIGGVQNAVANPLYARTGTAITLQVFGGQYYMEGYLASGGNVVHSRGHSKVLYWNV
jgi:hypothetical protein